MLSKITCPQCQSENTQKIANVIEQGTTLTEEKSTTSGIAVGSGGYASVSGSTNTSGVVQTKLAQKLSDEIEQYQKKVGGSPIVGIYLILLFVGIPIFAYLSFKTSSYFNSSIAGWATFIILFLTAAGVIGHLDEKGSFAPDEQTKEGWDKLKRWADSGYYCHGCGQRFILGSDEVHFSVK